MASGNVELVRSIYASWQRGDYLSSAEWAHPDIELVIADGPAPGSWTGLAGMADAVRDWLGGWKDYRTEPEEFRDVDDERVLVLIRRIGRGKRSGIDLGKMRAEGAGVFHVRDGKVIKLVNYWDREHALADLGLSE